MREGIFWSLLAFVGTKTLTFVSTVVLARLLAPSQFGVLAAILAFITLLEVISDLGMKATVIYESETGITDRVHTAFTLNLVFTVLLTIAALALAPVLAAYFNLESHVGLFRIAALDVLLQGLGNIHDSVLLRDMAFRRRIVSQVTGNVVRGGSTIALAVAGLGASALVVGFILGTAAWTASLWIITRYRPRVRIDRTAVRAIAVYGGWASALEILAAIAQRADAAVIGSVLGARALGLYTIAQRLPELIVGSVTWNLSIVAFPALAKRRDEDRDRLTDTTVSLIRYSALFGLSVGTALAVLAPPLIVVLFSEKWSQAATIMQPLALMYGLVCIVFPLGDTFKALGRQKVMVAVNAIAVPVAIAAMVLAAPGGIVPVAWTRVLVTVAFGFVWIVLITRALNLSVWTVARALSPAAAVAAGIAVAGGGARAAFEGLSIGPLAVTTVAAILGGAVMLRVFAQQEYFELRAALGQRLPSGFPISLRSRTGAPGSRR